MPPKRKSSQNSKPRDGKGHNHAATSATSSSKQNRILRAVIVMRHGEREDDCPGCARDVVMTDPNLTSKGVTETMAAAAQIAEHITPTLVVTSPFTRCVQTAQAAASVWGQKVCQVVHDYGLAEVHNATKIKGTDGVRPTLQPSVPASSCNVPQPDWGESLEGADERFAASIMRLAHAYGDTHECICLVSHGDSISTAARLGLVAEDPRDGVVVYNVDFSAYVCLRVPARGEDLFTSSSWCVAGSHGVGWMGAVDTGITMNSAFIQLF
eukprot:PhM_4_TR11383/c0_g1_i2/m.31361